MFPSHAALVGLAVLWRDPRNALWLMVFNRFAGHGIPRVFGGFRTLLWLMRSKVFCNDGFDVFLRAAGNLL